MRVFRCKCHEAKLTECPNRAESMDVIEVDVTCNCDGEWFGGEHVSTCPVGPTPTL